MKALEGEVMEDPLSRHVEFTAELAVQFETCDSLMIVDSDDNDQKYVLTDVRFDGDHIIAAIEPIRWGGGEPPK